MVQPKYSPEEALQRIKLMMEYDSSKTYTENKVIVENKQPLNEIAPLILWGIAAGVATAGTAILGREFSSADVEEQIKFALGACDSVTGDAATTSMDDKEHAKIANIFRNSFAYQTLGFIGAGTDLDLLKEALSMLEEGGRMGDFCKVRESYGAGSKLENDLISELGTKELNYVINTMNVLAAKSKAGSTPARNQESAQKNWWQDEFPCVDIQGSYVYPMVIETNPNNGNTSVKVKFKIKGVVKEFKLLYNGRIYTLDDKYTGKKVVCSGTKVSVVAESVKKKAIFEQADLGDIDLSPVDGDLDPATPGPVTPGPVRTGYRSCSGSYSFGCKADAISTVQKCLGGLVVDGKFGPKTQDALKSKVYESFTDAEVDKICGKDTEISGESPSDTDQNNLEF